MDIVDTALAPFALRSSQPAVEPMVVALKGTSATPDLTCNRCSSWASILNRSLPSTAIFLTSTQMSVIDTGVLMHQIPGGMISNLVSQLKEAGALDRLNEVYDGAAADPQRAGLPAAGHPHQPDRRRAGGPECAVRPLQNGIRPGQGLCLRSVRQTSGAHRSRSAGDDVSKAMSAARNPSPAAPPISWSRRWRRQSRLPKASPKISAMC